MPNKYFAERISNELDEMEFPANHQERVQALAKILKLPRFKAESILDGNVPDVDTLHHLSEELEVSVDWIMGKSNIKDTH